MAVNTSYQHEFRSEVPLDDLDSPYGARTKFLNPRTLAVALSCVVAGSLMFVFSSSNEAESSVWLSNMGLWGSSSSSRSSNRISDRKHPWRKWSSNDYGNNDDDYFGFDFDEHTFSATEKHIVKHKRRNPGRHRDGHGGRGKGHWDYVYKYKYDYDSDNDRYTVFPGLRLEGYPSLEDQKQYLQDFKAIDWDAVEKDIEHLLTNSQACELHQKKCYLIPMSSI
jgi:hypothetical protein